jgi:hypothetical protein
MDVLFAGYQLMALKRRYQEKAPKPPTRRSSGHAVGT